MSQAASPVSAVVTSGDSVCTESRTDRLRSRVEALRPVHEGPGPLKVSVCLSRVPITVETWPLGGAVLCRCWDFSGSQQPRFMAVVFSMGLVQGLMVAMVKSEDGPVATHTSNLWDDIRLACPAEDTQHKRDREPVIHETFEILAETHPINI